jgi:hypothetical protein
LDTRVKPAYDGALINVLQRHNPRDRLDRARDLRADLKATGKLHLHFALLVISITTSTTSTLQRHMLLRDQPNEICKHLLQVFMLGVSVTLIDQLRGILIAIWQPRTVAMSPTPDAAGLSSGGQLSAAMRQKLLL